LIPDMAMAGGIEDERLKQDAAARLRQLCAAIRLADGLTEKQIGLSCDVKPTTWSNYLNGKREIPYSVVIQLWRRYGAEPAWLIAGEARNNAPVFQAKLNALLSEPAPSTPRRGRPRK
jgi:transcriptional regulator with XRE-family HTH domain